MRVLFVVNRMTHVRHFDRAIRLLADRGHQVVLASQDDDVELRGVVANQERITPIVAPRNRTDDWSNHATVLRRARDYIRYLHPRYASAELLRARAFEKLLHAIGPDREVLGGWSDVLLGMNKKEQRRIDTLLTRLETTIPIDPEIQAFLEAQRPDVLVLSPMVGIGFSQADFVKSARALGIPSAMLVFSWDNLSNKGLVHEHPDRMIVWNSKQVEEAFKLHKFPKEQVVVTGAPRFDEFFEMRSATTREEFCGLVGLDPARPIVTYLCSSKFVAATEKDFVERWIGELRRSTDARLAGCSVLVRPHPAGTKGWHTDPRSVVRWPGLADKASTSRPFADAHTIVMNSPMQNADQVLYDTVFHSAAVVGLNTSAEIEAAIVGRPVFTIVDPQARGQKGTLHFHYLLQRNGGHVQLAESFDEHRRQLEQALAGPYDRAAIDSFIRTFVRPHGSDAPVSPFVADAIESLTGRGTAPHAFNQVGSALPS